MRTASRDRSGYPEAAAENYFTCRRARESAQIQTRRRTSAREGRRGIRTAPGAEKVRPPEGLSVSQKKFFSAGTVLFAWDRGAGREAPDAGTAADDGGAGLAMACLLSRKDTVCMLPPGKRFGYRGKFSAVYKCAEAVYMDLTGRGFYI